MGCVNALLTMQEPSILHTLRSRFSQDAIYTWVSSILISLNPCKPVDHLYTPQRMNVVASAARSAPTGAGGGAGAGGGSEAALAAEPHVFRVADEAYRALLRSGKNQSIVIR